MICMDCGKAGEMNWLLNTGTASTGLRDLMLEKAQTLHSRCKGGTWCDCQHHLGEHFLTFASG